MERRRFLEIGVTLIGGKVIYDALKPSVTQAQEEEITHETLAGAILQTHRESLQRDVDLLNGLNKTRVALDMKELVPSPDGNGLIEKISNNHQPDRPTL